MATSQELVDSCLGLCDSWKEQQRRISTYISTYMQRHSLCSAPGPRLPLAQYDYETITVYQAYKPSIALCAVRNGHFDNCEFSFSRMTWIKPSFSWMMHRSGWASKKNQEAILAIKLRRAYFDQLLSQCVSTTWNKTEFSSQSEWRSALQDSNVLVQWDPEHHIISGDRLEYRVIQIGIRRDALDGLKGNGIVSIEDVSERVRALRRELLNTHSSSAVSCEVKTPLETLYPIPERI